MAREAVANYFDEGEGGVWRVGKEDVVMTHGASGALEMVCKLDSFFPSLVYSFSFSSSFPV